ncbi:AI-2E family transporter [Massilia sp. Dwa41.01b]|uniref:AI-2E family transporter n=1 Tax=unclassified Massilia TaxID=2609279 RepID=UPI0016048C60|nr:MULTISPECIES: AI-2E family transporter [unclassified Massilia]QNA90737.1 AI-2E family transporter [Massilia sp. Dwa41.01b]QNA97974.1 AI-2E family transporter [Massilia sp. Se16.2.3]
MRRRTIRIEIAPRTMFTIVAIALGIALLTHLIPVVLVLITGLMLVGTLSPPVAWLERHRLGRLSAIALVFATLLLVVGALAVFTVPAFVVQVGSLVEQEPALRIKLVKFLASYPLTTSLAETLRHLQYGQLFKSYSTEAIAFSRDVLEIVAYGAGSIFLALYIMIDRDRLRGALFSVVPRAHHMKLSRIMLKLETIVGGYVRGQIVTCAMMATLLFIVLSACGVPNAIAIAAFGGIADVLPFVGIFLTMIPAVLAALGVSSVAATVVFVVLLCYEQFESRVLIPLIYGRALRLPSSVVLFSLITGGTLYGIAGALLALPLAATLLMLADELKMGLPGETPQPDDVTADRNDIVGEAEYMRRTGGMSAEASAGVALEISGERNVKEAQSPDPSRAPESG